MDRCCEFVCRGRAEWLTGGAGWGRKREVLGALAEKLRLTRTSIVNIEAGRQPLHAWQLAMTSAVLNVSLDALIPKLEIPSDIPEDLDEVKKRWIEEILTKKSGEITNGG